MKAESKLSNYYVQHQEKFLKQLNPLFKSCEKLLPDFIPVEKVEGILENTRRKFQGLLQELPEIGGDENLFIFAYAASAAALGLIEILEQNNMSVDDIGRLLYDIYGNVYRFLPGIIRWWLRKVEFSKQHINNIRAYAEKTQKREYPENWVFQFIEGDHTHFDFGCDYSECAVLKLVKRKGLEKYMPYICVGDFAVSDAIKTGLFRTSTLFFGGTCCDFRYKENYKALSGLPINKLPEFQNRVQ